MFLLILEHCTVKPLKRYDLKVLSNLFLEVLLIILIA